MPKSSPAGFRAETLSRPENVAVYAAAKNFTIGKARKGIPVTSTTSTGEEWQDTGWDFYDTIGEYRYAVDWVGNLLSRATLHVVENGDATDNQLAVDVMASLFGGEDGQAEMLRSLGIHYTVAGEAYVIGVDQQDEDEWFVIASTEIKRDGSGNFGVKGMGLEITDGGSLVMRLWRAHPRKPWKANSPTRAVLPILAELEKLTQHVAAQLDSRLAGAGLLLVPSEMTFPQMPTSLPAADPDAPPTAGTTTDGAQGFVNMLIDVMSRAIGDRADASAYVPIVLQIAGEYLEKVQHLKFWSELDEQAIELRKEAIGRLALGMDMPPEVLTGTADVNHWGAWQIDEASIKSHSEPLLKAITSALTQGYLRPVLEAEGMSREEAMAFSIKADTSQLRMRPNRSKESIELFEHGEVSASTMRRENGFDETDAPDDAERREWLIRKVASGSATPEMVVEALRLLGIAIVAAPESDEPNEARPNPSLLEHPDEGLPPEEASVSADVVAASEVMVHWALQRAGNRLKTRLGPKVKDIDVPAHELYLRMPELSSTEISTLLDDAWTCPIAPELNVDPVRLVQTLDQYAATLLGLRKPHDRTLLRMHLAAALDRADAP
jgi:hypothetical protein